jgi:hypothetical protein
MEHSVGFFVCLCMLMSVRFPAISQKYFHWIVSASLLYWLAGELILYIDVFPKYDGNSYTAITILYVTLYQNIPGYYFMYAVVLNLAFLIASVIAMISLGGADYFLVSFVLVIVSNILGSYGNEKIDRSRFALRYSVGIETKKAEELLYSIIPKQKADLMKLGNSITKIFVTFC